jgi:hypothetical protein
MRKEALLRVWVPISVVIAMAAAPPRCGAG